jgi:hypothetical protein
MATSKTTITSTAACRSLPPVGAVLLCSESPSAAAYPVTVDRHLGRYFIAGSHRFHVFDDWTTGATKPTWRTAAASVELLSPEEAAAVNLDRGFSYDALLEAPAPPARPVWRPPAPPAGPDEPTETW